MSESSGGLVGASAGPPPFVGAGGMAGAGRMRQVIDTLGEMFDDLSAGRIRFTERTVLEHGPGRQLLAGPAIWERHGAGSVKVTTLTPGNEAHGLPLIHGVVVLTDLATGRITALLDGAELTAVRTGAVAALATRRCTAPDADDLAIIGAGVQARALVRAITAVRPIRRVRVFSRTRGSAERLAAWIGEACGGRVRAEVRDTARSAVAGAAIICTATSTSDRTPVVRAGDVTPGAHLNAVGGTSETAIEFDPELLTDAFVVVEQRAAALAGAGEIRAAGLTAAALHELGELSHGAGEGRTTVFRSIGMALEDTAAAVALAGLTAGRGSGP